MQEFTDKQKHKTMKKLGLLLTLLLVMAMGSHRIFAQSVTVVLMPGWNWISCPMMDTLDFETAMGSFTPISGDIIKSQWGQSVYNGIICWLVIWPNQFVKPSSGFVNALGIYYG